MSEKERGNNTFFYSAFTFFSAMNRVVEYALHVTEKSFFFTDFQDGGGGTFFAVFGLYALTDGPVAFSYFYEIVFMTSAELMQHFIRNGV